MLPFSINKSDYISHDAPKSSPWRDCYQVRPQSIFLRTEHARGFLTFPHSSEMMRALERAQEQQGSRNLMTSDVRGVTPQTTEKVVPESLEDLPQYFMKVVTRKISVRDSG
ncbi:unnamed protein product [Natator depressus]